ncbi:MAG: DUF4430 domain-containing protein, partial [Firmicutes bacterium]|nr:DUF4430 domain-containing protein [Bacillota bacterium]
VEVNGSFEGAQQDVVDLQFSNDGFTMVDVYGDEYGFWREGAYTFFASMIEPAEAIEINGYEQKDSSKYYVFFTANSDTCQQDGTLAVVICVSPEGAESDALALTGATYNSTTSANVKLLENVSVATVDSESCTAESWYVVEVNGSFEGAQQDVVDLQFSNDGFTMVDVYGDEYGFWREGAYTFFASMIEPVETIGINGYEQKDSSKYYVFFTANSDTCQQDGKLAVVICVSPEGAGGGGDDTEGGATAGGDAIFAESVYLASGTLKGYDSKKTSIESGIYKVSFAEATTSFTLDLAKKGSETNDIYADLTVNGVSVLSSGNAGSLPALPGLPGLPGDSSESSGAEPVKITSQGTSLTVSQMGKFPVGQEVEMKLTVGKRNDNQWDASAEEYTFKVTRTVHITGVGANMTLTYENGSSVLTDPDFKSFIRATELIDEIVALIKPNTEILTFTVKNGSLKDFSVNIYVGENKLESDTATIKLSDYANVEGSDKYTVPVRVEYAGNGVANSSSFNLNIEETDAFPVITTQPSSTTCNKNDSVKLSVDVEEKSNQNLSYQWYSNNGNSSVLAMYPISGATEKNYTVPTSYASTTKYHCVVTNTVGDKTYTTTSDTAVIITNLTNVNDPTVEITSGGDGDYYEYGSPGRFDIVAKTTDFITFNDIVVQLYCTDKNAAEGGELVWEYNPGSLGSTSAPVDYNTQWYSGADAPNVPTGKPAGTWYYYAKVTMEYDGNIYSAVSETKAVTYKPYSDLIGDNLEGKGTAEEPFLIETLADLEYIQALVNRAGATVDMARPGATGYSLDGTNFRLAADIELPLEWEPIGSLKPYKRDPELGMMINPFSGIFDGAGHKITVAEGGKPLFGYVRNATIKNLKIYGTKIAGEGLIDNYTVDYGADGESNTGIPATATIDNVTILSGTKTLGSGLIGGNASARNTVEIKNCTVEKGVTIGYEVNEDLGGIGSLAGRFNGTVFNCTSYATVNGKDNVGGLVGTKGEAMGPFSVTNSSFHGEVVATGEFAGGIVGGGYKSHSAPNAPCVIIDNCFVTGKITGATNVGGVFGGEGGVSQCWDNGGGFVRNNHFYGTVTATAEGGIKGGIIGYMKSLNKFNVIENNYYVDSCGAASGIGMVQIVDSSSDNIKNTPVWKNGTYYINTAKDDISVIDTELKKLNESTYSQLSKANSNRTDDPTGIDADNLAKAMTAAQFKDGTVTALLNQAESSLHNWTTGDNYPVHTTDPVVYKLEISDEYTKDYYIGDSFNFGNATITAYYSDNTAKVIDAKDVIITGFESKTRGQKTVTVSYGAAKTQLIVVVLEKINENQKNEITVSFRLLGDTLHGDDGQTHTMATGGLTTWVSGSYTLPKNSTVEDLLKKVDEDNTNITIYGRWYGQYGSSYIYAVEYNNVNLAEFDNGKFSGWKYTVNGKYPEIGVSAYYLDNYDSVVFHYTDDYTKESDAKDMGALPKEEETTEVITGKEAGETTSTTTTPTEVTVSGSTATATVTKENVTETIKQATENKSAEIVVQVTESDTKGAANVKVQLDTTTVKDVVKKTEAALTVKTENATVTLDRETLKTVAAEATGSTVTLEVIEVAKPTEAHKEVAGENGHVIQLVIKSGTKTISLFNEGKATVTVEIPSKLTGKKVAAIHIGDDGKIEHLKGQEVIVNGKKHYRFDTPHFSTFALVDADEIGLEAEEQTMTAEEVKELLADLSPVARSVKTAKKNVKVTLKLDAGDKAIIEALEAEGFTVKYNFYRSTKKSSKYSSRLIKGTTTYTQTGGKKGTKYYYKARVQVYDAEGKLVARTELKQCKYAARTWSK